MLSTRALQLIVSSNVRAGSPLLRAIPRSGRRSYRLGPAVPKADGLRRVHRDHRGGALVPFARAGLPRPPHRPRALRRAVPPAPHRPALGSSARRRQRRRGGPGGTDGGGGDGGIRAELQRPAELAPCHPWWWWRWRRRRRPEKRTPARQDVRGKRPSHMPPHEAKPAAGRPGCATQSAVQCCAAHPRPGTRTCVANVRAEGGACAPVPLRC
jgi:hypothetical protein